MPVPMMQPKRKLELDPDAEARKMMLDKSMVPAAAPIARPKPPSPLANGANGLTPGTAPPPPKAAPPPPVATPTTATTPAAAVDPVGTAAAQQAADAEAARQQAIEVAKRKAKQEAEAKAKANAEATAVHSTDDVDEAARRLFFQQIQDAMNPDTSADEALATEQADALRGADIVNQRARAGRAGFGASGAQMAMESDIERASRMGLTDKVLGIRNDAKQRGIDNALSAVGADVDLREAGSNAAINAKLLELLGMDEGDVAPPAPNTDAGTAGANTQDGFAKDGKVTSSTGTYPTETVKRSPDDVLSQTISAGGKRYQVFIDGKASKPGKKPVLYAVAQA